MKLSLEWSRPVVLKDGTKLNMIYLIDTAKLPSTSGIYIFGRRWGAGIEALYVGKANNIRSRVKGQFNNLRLMQHVRHAKTGKRILLFGRIVTKTGQQLERSLRLIERAFIRHFLSEGHDIVNKQGTRLRHHEITSDGNHPKRFFPQKMYLERTR